jgi:hypothetical protein
MCIVDITDVLTLGGKIEALGQDPYDYTVIEFPDIFDGNFEFKEESRLGENLIELFDDIAIIQSYIQLESPAELPELTQVSHSDP